MEAAPVKERIAETGGFASRLWIRWFQYVQNALGAAVIETTRITFADSPYTAAEGVNLVCDTDGGAMVVNFPAGRQGVPIRVVNAGSSGNSVTLDGSGTEKIRGAATHVLLSGVVLETRFDSVEGWW